MTATINDRLQSCLQSAGLMRSVIDFENFDKAIYSCHKDFSLLVQLVENKNFSILRPYGSFDDRDFCIEIYDLN